jgi:hypothetical protein
MARVSPLLELSADGGQVVITRFECPTLAALIAVRLVHARLKPAVQCGAQGFIGVTTITDWKRRTMLSISLWQNLDSIYSLGNVPQHVAAARIPSRLGVSTTCGIFCLAGDWRRVMFRIETKARSPLHPLTRGHSHPGPARSPKPTGETRSPGGRGAQAAD